MEVPFISSGALSRKHYALVRKVELAQTTQQADNYLIEELVLVRDRLSRPGFSSAQCRECLILLLYCSMNTVAGLPPGALEFALPHAVNWPKRVPPSRKGRQIMPPHHELKLMLVNTIRKDLEADSVMRVTLALNFLIQCPSEDIIPAIQARLHYLLSHKSPHIRRRALYTVHALAECDPALLRWLSPEVSRCLRDRDPTVIGSALATLRILINVDPSIVQLYFSQRLEGLDSSAESYEDEVLALLEVIKALAGEDAELYARSVRDTLSPIGTVSSVQQSTRVLERAVENVLSTLRDGDTTFGANVATTLLTPLAELEAEAPFSPTMMIILTALACEYAGRVPVSPLQLLRGLGKRLTSYSVSIEEVILLTMIRLAAECHEVPLELISDVQNLGSRSSRLISRVSIPSSTPRHLYLSLTTNTLQRCIQFEDMIGKPEELKAAVANSRSRSLPDFLLALESTPSPLPRSPRVGPSSPTASKLSLSGAQKLRYAAYEPPPPAHPRRSRATSNSRSTSSPDPRDDLARTVTAGDLAMAAGSPELRALSLPSQPIRSPPISPASKPETVNLHSPRVDLISLDSPFIVEPRAGEASTREQGEQHHDFANVWDTVSAFSARGWCGGTPDSVVRHLQGLKLPRGLAVLPADQSPFQGELKILILGGVGERDRAALRLHENSVDDEDGCLWRMRSEDEGILTAVKQILAV
ncbi:armadillo-type protein [Multifurca ochricompacta]|uniref:Armadillo-type protein n=1 Tax=Multifurca ochricompacta TaxID=376703 RepID=A0AAD4M6C7_9AGAM|nr:armadillo-type protein [Multifurca ochricompacta]